MASDQPAPRGVVVLDSSFLIGFHNAADVHHATAVGVMDRLLAGEWDDILLLEYVLLEVLTVLRMRLDLPTAVGVGETLLRSREVRFVPSSDIFLRAFDTFRHERQAELSFVDAAIVAVARQHGPAHVATFDAGFARVDGVTMVPAAEPA